MTTTEEWIKQPSKTRFTKLVYESHDPKPGFDVWVALLSDARGQMMIGAPTLDELESRWFEIVGTDLDRHRAQHVLVIQSNAPEAMLEQAKRIARGEALPDTSTGEQK